MNVKEKQFKIPKPNSSVFDRNLQTHTQKIRNIFFFVHSCKTHFLTFVRQITQKCADIVKQRDFYIKKTYLYCQS